MVSRLVSALFVSTVFLASVGLMGCASNSADTAESTENSTGANADSPEFYKDGGGGRIVYDGSSWLIIASHQQSDLEGFFDGDEGNHQVFWETSKAVLFTISNIPSRAKKFECNVTVYNNRDGDKVKSVTIVPANGEKDSICKLFLGVYKNGKEPLPDVGYLSVQSISC
jgi:hypothetical protein